jgi:hypothetical protein
MSCHRLGVLVALTAFPGLLRAEEPYALEVQEAQRVGAVMTHEAAATDFRVQNWLIFVAKAPELPSQVRVRSLAQPAGEVIKELSPLRREVLALRIPATSAELRKKVRVRVKHEATLLSRRLVPLPEKSRPAVKPLGMAARKLALAATDSLNFKDKAFQQWLTTHRLARREGEPETDFALRVLEAIRANFTYAFFEHERKAARVCDTGRTDCAGLSVVFAGALRANGIPARCLYGRLAKSRDPKARPDSWEYNQVHARAEFFADGIGWVPADPACANLNKDRPVRDYLGNDPGDLLVLHVDPDLELPNMLATREKSLLQTYSFYVTGQGNLDVQDGPSDWQVRVLPAGDEAARPAEASKADEESAAANLRYAKKLDANDERDKARRRLQEVIGEYPGTPAAREARQLLDKWGK